MANVRFDFLLPEELKRDVEEVALKLEISQSEVVRRALRVEGAAAVAETNLHAIGRLTISTEPGFPDARELLERSLRNIGALMYEPRRLLRWGAVSRLTGLGSTYAAILCRAAGLNPDDEIGPTEWEAFTELLGESFDGERWEEITGEEPPPENERHRREIL